MGSFREDRPDGTDGFDEVRFGPSRPPVRWRPPRRLVAAGTAAAVLAVAAVVAVVATLSAGHRGQPPRPALPVSGAGHRLLGVTAGWELAGYGAGQVVRIQFARGLIARTAVPPLLSSGPVSFAAGPGQVIVRPLDFVPGYLVPDRGPARALSGLLAHGGTVMRGPRPGTVWFQGGYQARSLPLVRMDGARTGTALRLPGRGGWLATPDGQGYVLVSSISTGALYDVRPGGSRRLFGTLIAVGPASWLTVDCPDRRRCSYVVVDSASGARRVLPGRLVRSAARPPLVIAAPGVIAPGGSAAAVIRAAPGGRLSLHLIGLEDGSDHRIPVRMDQAPIGPQTLAWSPDGRWLFVAAANNTLVAVNARTERIENVSGMIPPVSEIAIRNSPPAGR